MLVCAFASAFCTRDRGYSVYPAFPAPSIFEGRLRPLFSRDEISQIGRIAPRQYRFVFGDNLRRPGLEPGPITTDANVARAGSNPFHNAHWWLWVPARRPGRR